MDTDEAGSCAAIPASPEGLFWSGRREVEACAAALQSIVRVALGVAGPGHAVDAMAQRSSCSAPDFYLVMASPLLSAAKELLWEVICI